MSFTLIFYNAMLWSRVEPYFPSVILGQLFSLRKNVYSLLNFELQHLKAFLRSPPSLSPRCVIMSIWD